MRHTIDNTLRLAEVHPPRVSQPRLAFFKDRPMKYIPLTQGKFAIVDDEDYEWLIQYKWHVVKMGKCCYAARSPWINGMSKRVFMHREIMEQYGIKSRYYDHINHNGIDNQKENVRPVTNAQNQQNQRPQVDSFSKYKGVSWNNQREKWQVHITHNKKAKHIGLFVNELEAAKAYDNVAMKYFGEYACTNISKGII